MKHLFICILSCLFLSCGQNTDKAQTPDSLAKELAESFLTAYLHLDFDEALPLCGQALQADLELSAQRVRSLSPDMQEILKEDLQAYSCKIDNLNFNSSKDSVFVDYTIITPEAPDGFPGSLTVAKEEQEWKVVKLL